MILNRRSANIPWRTQNRVQQGGRSVNNQAIYNSKRWRQASKLARFHTPWCPVCLAMGIDEPSAETDHAVPIRLNGSVWDARNHLPLCRSCHATKSTWERTWKRTIPFATIRAESKLIAASVAEVIEMIVALKGEGLSNL